MRVATLCLVFFLLAIGLQANAAESFPPNCTALPGGWSTPAGANTGWIVATDVSLEGLCSMKSVTPGDAAAEGLYKTSQLQFTGNFVAGSIRFAYRISSEEGYDCLRFFVDGAPQGFASSCLYNHSGIGASGALDWTFVEVPVPAGVHTITWSYEKDFADTQGSDTAWIDNVVLPLALPVITSGAAPGGNVGTPYSHAFTASANPTATFGVAGGQLPPGLGLNATTGALSGTPTAAGTFIATIAATNFGGSGTQSATIVIAPTVPGAPVITSATPGNGLAVIAFSPPANDGGSAITGYVATCNPGAVSVGGPASPITVGGLANGTPYSCTVIASNSAGAGAPSAPASVTPGAATPLTLAQVQSRKVHGAAGPFDIALDTAQAISGAVSVEPRAIGPGHKVVFQFNAAIAAAGTVACMDSLAVPVGTCNAVAAGNTVEVTLTGVPDAKRVAITLTNVNGAGGSFAVALGFLLGDVNNSRTVSASDVLEVKGRAARAVNASTFIYDLNLTGGITATDILAVKGRSGGGL